MFEVLFKMYVCAVVYLYKKIKKDRHQHKLITLPDWGEVKMLIG